MLSITGIKNKCCIYLITLTFQNPLTTPCLPALLCRPHVAEAFFDHRNFLRQQKFSSTTEALAKVVAKVVVKVVAEAQPATIGHHRLVDDFSRRRFRQGATRNFKLKSITFGFSMFIVKEVWSGFFAIPKNENPLSTRTFI